MIVITEAKELNDCFGIINDVDECAGWNPYRAFRNIYGTIYGTSTHNAGSSIFVEVLPGMFGMVIQNHHQAPLQGSSPQNLEAWKKDSSLHELTSPAPGLLLTTVPVRTVATYAHALRRGYIVAFAILVVVIASSSFMLHRQLALQNDAETTRHLLLQQGGDLSHARGIVALILQSFDLPEGSPYLMAVALTELDRIAARLRNQQGQIDVLLQQLPIDAEGLSASDIEQKSHMVHALADKLSGFAKNESEMIGWRFSLWAPLMLDLAHDAPLEMMLNREIRYLDERVRASAQRTQVTNGILTAISFTVLALEVLFIFLPLLRRLVRLGARLDVMTLELQQAALYDALTSVGNRKLLEQSVAHWTTHRTQPRSGALMIIDLNDFKSINDIYGHPVGDEVLRVTAQRMASSIGRGGQIFRSGGDEFVAVWFEPCDANGAIEVAERLMAAITMPIMFSNPTQMTLQCGAAVGIALVDEIEGSTLIDLMRAADLAQRMAKRPSASRIVVYGQDSTLRQRELLSLASKFSTGLQRGEVRPYYQPVVDLDSGHVIGFEALARWISPDLGVLLPGDFLPLAEQNHQIGTLVEVMLRQVAIDRQRFLDIGLESCKIGVNFDEANLIDDQLLNHIQEWIGSSDLSWLTVEIVETVLLQRSWQRIHSNLLRLAEQGAAIALDDFGTGNASLQHLLSVPCKVIKIDNSFVARLNDSSVAQVVHSMVEMARGLDIAVVIEGLETDKQCIYFRDRWGGLYGQGFGIGRPVDVDNTVCYLKDKLCGTPSI